MIAAVTPFPTSSIVPIDGGSPLPLDADLPFPLLVRSPTFICLNAKCVHSDGYHHWVFGGILGDRWVCDVCSAEGGRCQ